MLKILPARFIIHLVIFICLGCFPSAYVQAEEAAPEIQLSSEFSDEGHVGISWKWRDEPAEFQLWVNDERVYLGSERATFVSGLDTGDYLIKLGVKTASNPDKIIWSTPKNFQVEHQPDSLVYTFILLGGTVFLLTVLVIFTGDKKSHV